MRGRRIERVAQAAGKPLRARPRDDRRIVGAQPRRRHQQWQLILQGYVEQRVAHRLVGDDAAGRDQRGRHPEALPKHAQSLAQAVGHHFDDRELERGAQIGDVLVGQGRDLFGFEPHRGLQSG